MNGLFSRKKDVNKLFEKALKFYQANEFEKAYAIWEETAELGNIVAQFNCGLMCYKGQGVRKDLAKAVAFWEKAAAQGHETAEKMLPELKMKKEFGDAKLLYHSGQYEKALPGFLSLAERGYAEALRYCAFLYKEGRGTEKDAGKALAYYLRAAETGDEDALFACGEHYEAGIVCEKDLDKALSYYAKAAEKDQVPAMIRLGKYYYAQKEYEKSYQYFKSAVGADEEADFMEAKMRFYGLGTQCDKEEAVPFLKWIAEERSNAEAMFILSRYWAEKGDIKLCREWLRLATEEGCEEAVSEYEKI
ncbi:MAG: sel1 repeat family protein [Clostridiales bacterium]|nr:sel1 repeat family protein [Clostridiales bacterium]